MSAKANRAVTIWLFVVCALIIFMVSFGGLVRLTRSGLSIVEWNPVSGVIPPVGDQAWQLEFEKYQQTPEFQKVNHEMTLEGYKRIFMLEYIHRLIARFAGLIVVIPLLYFLIRGIIPWRKSAVYLLIAAGFAFQGALGWYMVSSGLIDRPSVSHYRLTAHLLTAIALLALTFWMGLRHLYNFPAKEPKGGKSFGYRLSWLLVAVLVIQMSYGGLVAGLKAGHASNTWPLMFGYLIPPGMLSVIEPWWLNLIETATTIHFMHRWFAFAVLIVAVVLYFVARKRHYSQAIHNGILLMIVLTFVQIGLGISVVWLGVPIWLALLHQGTALLLFLTAIYLIYQCGHAMQPETATTPAALRVEPA
ncbi:MAG: COX15/CtaA family protein [Caldilineales bacterium]|nr:COX15/CtaA family protein [Caldilineales bacterium]